MKKQKKDQQLISNVVRKIDIASQDYAEDAELATGLADTFFLAAGGLSAFITNKLAKLAKTKHPFAFSLIVGGAISIAGASIATKIQKQASRVARYKVKKDFLENPQKLFYVDDEKVKNEDGEKYRQKEKKQNLLQFMFQLYKDNKEYNEYLKTQNVAQKQRQKAQSQIEITPEQEKRARQLQQNVFKVFNKVDDKSQTYSESTEALGEIVSEAINTVTALPAMFAMFKLSSEIPNAAEECKSTSEALSKFIPKMLKSYALPYALILVPALIMNWLITKEQKQASRTADMLALDELKDYRHFADFSSLKEDDKSKKTQSVSLSQNKKDTFQLSPLMRDRLNKIK